MLSIKNPQFYSDLAEILAILSTHGLKILTKSEKDRTKTVDFLLCISIFWGKFNYFYQSLGCYICHTILRVKREQGALVEFQRSF